MAANIEHPMLSINPGKMGQVDASNNNSLAGVWGDGPRLENMSWRLWSRRTIRSNSPSSSPSRRHQLYSSSSTPLHSHHIDRSSLPSNLLDRRRSAQSSSSSISSTQSASLPTAQTTPTMSLEKMVSSIKGQQEIEPLSASITAALPKLPSPECASPEMTSPSPPPHPPMSKVPHRCSDSSTSTAPASEYASERSARPSVASDTSAEVLSCDNPKNHRGFLVGQSPSSFQSNTHLTPSESAVKSVKRGGGFLLGGSSGDDESSFDERMQPQSQESSLTAALKKSTGGKKQLSFRDVVESRRMGNKSHEDEEVFESDDEDDVSDSAIDDSDVDEDEDDGEWEDDGSENDDHDKPLFQRVDSKPNLTSRRSLLTTMMNEEGRAQNFQELAMQQQPSGLRRSKTSGNVASQQGSALSPNNTSTPSKPILRTKSDLISLVSSPKTTRRNMLSTEIDENLRKSILHERLQKRSTLNAYNKRVQSARNLSSMPIHAEREEPARDDVDYYSTGTGNYHQVGW